MAAATYPALFSSLILIAPIIIQGQVFHRGEVIDRWAHRRITVLQTLARRAAWPSRAAARTALLASPFFRSWHPSVLDAYLSHGLAPIRTGNGGEDGEVALKTTPEQEAAVFVEGCHPVEVYEHLDLLDERIALFWILPANDDGIDGLEGMRARVWRRPKNMTNLRLQGAGHLVS